MCEAPYGGPGRSPLSSMTNQNRTTLEQNQGEDLGVQTGDAQKFIPAGAKRHASAMSRGTTRSAVLEAPSGFEPLHRSFADCSLSHLGMAPRGKGHYIR